MAYDYGCVMASGWPDGWSRVLSCIDREDVYSEEENSGLEVNPHVTVLYGLHDEVHSDLVGRICKSVREPVEIKIVGASTFDNNPDYDVLKYDIESDKLRQLNRVFSSFPHTNEHDDYSPHLTVGYLKRGRGEDYTSQIRDKIGRRLTFDCLRFRPSGSSMQHFDFKL